ncbi:MAG: hypothetical protein U0790_25310 [Isosphaeraceae bacterium]
MHESFRELRYYHLAVAFTAGAMKLGMDLFTSLTGEPLWRFKVYWLTTIRDALMAWHFWG